MFSVDACDAGGVHDRVVGVTGVRQPRLEGRRGRDPAQPWTQVRTPRQTRTRTGAGPRAGSLPTPPQ